MTATGLMAKPKCGAPKRQGGDPCTRPAGWGTDHAGVGKCKLHGGSSPSGKKAAAKQVLLQTVGELGVLVPMEPHDLMLAAVYATAGQLAFAQGQIAKVKADAAEGSFWLELQSQALDRASRVAKAAMDAGIAERRVRLAERTGALIAAAAERAMGRMARPIPVEDRAEFARLFGAELAGLEMADAGEGA